ncbi:MAG: Zn-ribbon domain-containing OB-fold protein [Candidatus Lokiarchaeota archaeon]|nr:Zn-ribbon domain-containing OB-fold protein [Candidatus Lokiarchaeota archaeon]
MSDKPFTVQSYIDYINQKKLMGTKCKDCGNIDLPPRGVCSKCMSSNVGWIEVEGKGKLATFSAIHVGTTFMNNKGYSMKKPYLFGTIDLDSGPSIAAHVKGLDELNPEKIKIGTRLKINYEDGTEAFTDRSGKQEERPKVFITFVPE